MYLLRRAAAAGKVVATEKSALLAAGLAVTLGVPAASIANAAFVETVLIDTFDLPYDGDGLLVVTIAAPTDSVTGQTDGSIFGERDATLELDSGILGLSSVGVSGGVLTVDAGAASLISLTLDYDFSAIDLSSVATTGSLGVDVSFLQGDVTLTPIINGVSGTPISPGSTGPVTFDYTTFVGVDFSTVTSLGLVIEADSEAADIALSEFTFVIPEPMTGVLMGLGLAAFMCRRTDPARSIG